MKLVLTVMLLGIGFLGIAQAIVVKAGKTLLPGDYIGIGYEHYTNSAVNGRVNLFTESGHQNGLHYSAYGLDLLGEYGSNQNDRGLFAFRVGLGATGHIENEPWIYASLSGSQKLNYGFVSEVSGEWWMSEQFCLSVFGQQKWLFNTALGRTRFNYGIGLKFHFEGK